MHWAQARVGVIREQGPFWWRWLEPAPIVNSIRSHQHWRHLVRQDDIGHQPLTRPSVSSMETTVTHVYSSALLVIVWTILDNIKEWQITSISPREGKNYIIDQKLSISFHLMKILKFLGKKLALNRQDTSRSHQLAKEYYIFHILLRTWITTTGKELKKLWRQRSSFIYWVQK